jgi:hypothetical protein
MLVIIQSKLVAAILVIGALLFSCAKKDVDPPVISIISPTANTSYQLPTTITIKGTVTDDNSINNLKINILDENQAPISTEKNISIGSTESSFEESFQINDRLLTSGTYYINVKAFDEENNLSSSYSSIQISEIPRFLKSVFLLRQTGGITYLDQLSVANGFVSTQNILFLTGDFQKSISNSRHQYIFVGTEDMGNAFEDEFFTDLWMISPVLSPYAYFTGLHLTDLGNQLHVVSGDGVIKTYNKNGQITNAIYAANQEWFGEVVFDDNFIIGEVFSSLILRNLVVFNRNSGVENQRVQTIGQLVKIGKLTDDICYVVNQYQDDLQLKKYAISTNNYWLEYDLPNCHVYDAFYKDNLLYMATDLGFLRYNFITMSLVNLNGQYAFHRLKFDDISGLFYLISSSELCLFDEVNNSIDTWVISDSLTDVLLYYNK